MFTYLLALLPLLFAITLFRIVYGNVCFGKNTSNLRDAFLLTVLMTCTYVVAVTEILNAYHLINQRWLLIVWLLPTFAMGAYSFITRTKQKRIEILKLLPLQNWMFWTILTFILISLCIGLVYPTNNYDSLTYHMARVAHWSQNQSIDHYATHILRQLVFPPFAEWSILHLQILSGSDRWANTVQLFFFAGCIANASLIAREFGASYKQQWDCALFCCFLPMGIIQSNTTQNDIVAAFFVSCFALLTIRTVRKPTLSLAIYSGIALGLAWFTKGTAFLFTVGFCLWFIVAFFKAIKDKSDVGKRFSLFFLIPLIATIINSGHFYRNYQLTESVLGNTGQSTLNEKHEITQLTLVGFKNFLNHMPVSRGLKNLLKSGTEKLGIDIDDPRYNYNTIEWMKVGFSFDEDYAQNFVHTVLIIIVGILYLFKRNSFNDGIYFTFFGYTVLFTTLLFCVALKWQPWSNRLETSLFIFFSVISGLEISRWKLRAQIICYASLFAFGIGALLWSSNHPLLPPRKSIFQNDYNSFIYRQGHLECKTFIDSAGYRKIGIYIGPDSQDYIFYKMLAQNGENGRILEHVRVRNISEVYDNKHFYPDAIISSDDTAEELTVNGKVLYRRRVFAPSLAVFVK